MCRRYCGGLARSSDRGNARRRDVGGAHGRHGPCERLDRMEQARVASRALA